jgi:hypothetical protein
VSGEYAELTVLPSGLTCVKNAEFLHERKNENKIIQNLLTRVGDPDPDLDPSFRGMDPDPDPDTSLFT